MNTKFILTALLVFMGLALFSPASAAGDSGEDAKIKALMAHVESLEGAVFIRNGKEYDAATAAKFLTGKWNENKKSVATASEFIAKVATKSSTTGKPYLIRLKGGENIPFDQYLKQRLKTIASLR